LQEKVPEKKVEEKGRKLKTLLDFV